MCKWFIYLRFCVFFFFGEFKWLQSLCAPSSNSIIIFIFLLTIFGIVVAVTPIKCIKINQIRKRATNIFLTTRKRRLSPNWCVDCELNCTHTFYS